MDCGAIDGGGWPVVVLHAAADGRRWRKGFRFRVGREELERGMKKEVRLGAGEDVAS